MLGEAAAAALHWAMAQVLRGAMTLALLCFFSGAPRADPVRSTEVSAGADASTHVWLLYTGATLAPYGDMFADGIRVRATTGYGQYSYTGERGGVLRSFAAQSQFAEALVGYLKRLGPLTAKAFVGGAAIEHRISPVDTENPVLGREYGPKAVVELWLNMGPKAWSSLDLNWTSAHETYAGRLRTAYRVLERVSVGAEARINGNALDKDARGGLFVRYDWPGGEVSLAGGVAGRFLEDASDMTDPYAALTWLMQY